MSFIEGQNRQKAIVFNSLDEAIEQDNIVRLIDTLVEELIAAAPDFYLYKGGSDTGRPAYHPSIFLKIYLYGYLNGISSSRKLERECKRNVELMWLTGKLAPDFKTIADYRKDQPEQLESVFYAFNSFLIDQGYIQGKEISLDGTKLKANATKVHKKERTEKLLEKAQRRLAKYLERLDQADLEEGEVEAAPEVQDGPMELGTESDLMAQLGEEIQRKEALEQELDWFEKEQTGKYSPTDPDARFMKNPQGFFIGYNLQACIDAKHKLIADVELSSSSTDNGLLLPAIERLANRWGITPKEVLADAGFSKIETILLLQAAGINCFISLNLNQGQVRDQRNRIQFVYDPEQDHYTCPEGQFLSCVLRNKVDKRRQTVFDQYQAQDCRGCHRKSHCAPKAKQARMVLRYHNQAARDAYTNKMASDTGKKKIQKRASLSEHPFGTLKSWMGRFHLLLRGKRKASVEIRLYATAYNLFRMTNIESALELNKKIKEYDWKTVLEKVKRNIQSYLDFLTQVRNTFKLSWI